jgi:hypothetical protein
MYSLSSFLCDLLRTNRAQLINLALCLRIQLASVSFRLSWAASAIRFRAGIGRMAGGGSSGLHQEATTLDLLSASLPWIPKDSLIDVFM